MASSIAVLTVAAPATMPVGPAQGQWTYADYAALPADGNRYEVIDGVLYVSPAPVIVHQHIILRIAYYLVISVEDTKLGIVLIAPTDVEFPPHRTTVQPDVIVVLNANRHVLTPSRIVGAPDLVVEVASPSTATYDRRAKMDAYAAAGVPEYWIADPMAKTVELFYLVDGAYESAGLFQDADRLPSRVLPDFAARVEQFFE